jgi:hypothetical protein
MMYKRDHNLPNEHRSGRRRPKAGAAWGLAILSLTGLAAGCDNSAGDSGKDEFNRRPNVAVILFDKSGSNRIDSVEVKQAVAAAVDAMVVRPKEKKNNLSYCNGGSVLFCGTIDGKTIDRGLKQFPLGVDFCRQTCDDENSTADCNRQESAANQKIKRRRQELDSLVWAYRMEPPSDRTTTDVLSALVLINREFNRGKYGKRTLHIFSDMLSEVKGGRNFDKNPPGDKNTAVQWAQADWDALKKQYGLDEMGFRGMQVVIHTPSNVKDLQKVALYWRYLFEDILQTQMVEGL